MLNDQSCFKPIIKSAAMVSLATLLLMLVTLEVRPQSGAAKLLNEATYYQSGDDTSDRAAELYRELMLKYPTSPQAEQAQFYLGTYYQNKFFILDHNYGKQDWSAFNQAEEALNTYIKKYSRGRYVADAYFALAMISLRRGYHDKYRDDARELLTKMSGQSADIRVFIYKVVWTPYPGDVVKRTCEKNTLATGENTLIDRNSTFEKFTIALREWCRVNCR